MALTITLVEATPNRLRYLLTTAGGGGSATITCSGGVSPDLITDTLQGPLKKLAKVVADGYGSFAAGAQTQAKARALWLSDWSGADPAPGDPAGVPSLITTAICRLDTRTTGAGLAAVDADVDTGVPEINVDLAAVAGGNAYLDIMVPEAIG